MATKHIIDELNSIFEGVELVVRSRISEEINDEIFNDEYNIYLSKKDYSSYELKKSLEKLLRRAKKNYSDAKNLFYIGRLSEEDLLEYKRRIDEINNIKL